MALRSIEEVALYAVLLRSCADNRHTDTVSLLEDLECEHRDGLSFAQMLAHERFTDFDWRLVQVLCDGHAITETARILYCEHEQVVEAEALLHAGHPSGNRARAQWAAPFRARWQAVRKSIAAYEAEGITITTGDLNDVAAAAYRAVTGATRNEIDDRFGTAWEDALLTS